MTFSQLENDILLQVVKQPRNVSFLYNIFIFQKKLSKAGFYKALTTLKRKEIVFLKNKIVSVNKIWLTKSYEFFENLIQQKTEPSYLARQISKLTKNEKIIYTFNSITNIDIFILNLLYDLVLLKIDKYILISELHEFFVLFNHERTEQILNEFKKMNIFVYLLIFGQTANDKEVVKKHLIEPAQGYAPNTKRGSTDPNKIIHVVGDVIIELSLDKQLVLELNKLFTSQKQINEDFMTGLNSLQNTKRKFKITIYKNQEKTHILKNKFSKFFLLK